MDLIFGKRCVVVASSGYLRGRGKTSRDFIESFDLVVKASDMCEIPDPQNELGRRCDIWYGLPKVPAWEADLDALVRQRVQLIVLQPRLDKYASIWDSCQQWLDSQIIAFPLQYEAADAKHYENLIEEIGCIPFSGFFAIRDLLHRGASEVYAYGHDFFESGYFKDSEIYDVIDSGWHLLEPQMLAMWQLLQTEPRFKCDANLQDLLNRKFASQGPLENVTNLFGKELEHFSQLTSLERTLVFRSCREEVFNLIFDTLIDFTPASCITLVCQSDFVLSEKLAKCNLIRVSSNTFTEYSLSAADNLSLAHFDTCFVPYNGLALHTYLEIFLSIKAIGINTVNLINTRGAVKRLDNLEKIMQDIQYYLSMRREFRCLQDRYDRKKGF